MTLDLALLIAFYLLLMDTLCDFEGNYWPCKNRAYGKLRGCRQQPSHGRGKRDVLFRSFGMLNPGSLVRWIWQPAPHQRRPPRPVRPIPADYSNGDRSQALYNLLSLAVAVISAVAGVLALFIGPS